MTVKDFLDTNDFTKDQLLDMIELSRVLKRCVKAGDFPELLKHKTLGMIFQQVSTVIKSVSRLYSALIAKRHRINIPSARPDRVRCKKKCTAACVHHKHA